MKPLLSWGRYPKVPQIPHAVGWPHELPQLHQAIRVQAAGGALPFGCGRSYGDSCLAESDHVLAMQGMNRILNVDWETGVLRAQAGLTLAEVIDVALPRGWFLPVTPGTKFVSLGGAVANDVHGKNHHVMGTLGRHVNRLMLYRSDEGFVECSQDQRPNLFAATVGGLGLTGVIVSVELQLRRVGSGLISQQTTRFGALDEFFALSRQYDSAHEYTVAWIDCLATGKDAGRGHYIAGNHAPSGPLELAVGGGLRVPFDPPVSLVNPVSLRVFNTLYYHRQRAKQRCTTVAYDPFFYPLDKIQQWNRMYGTAGFQQFQCVVPTPHGPDVIRTMLKEIARSGTGSFLAVLKQCGNLRSPGLLSFPMEGVSLALDFPQRQNVNEALFQTLDAIVHEAGGRLYPAKDAHMQAQHFRDAYPEWSKLEAQRDPLLLSKFWKRMTQ